MSPKSERITSLLDPNSDAARAVSLGRSAFLRELIIALLCSTSAPSIILAGLWFIRDGAPIGLTVILIWLTIICVAGPIIIYSTLRMNAAALGRQRRIHGPDGFVIHKPMSGPWGGARVPLSGSTKSRTIGGISSYPAVMLSLRLLLGPLMNPIMWAMLIIPFGICLFLAATLLFAPESPATPS